jgi:hypothetical protein
MVAGAIFRDQMIDLGNRQRSFGGGIFGGIVDRAESKVHAECGF